MTHTELSSDRRLRTLFYILIVSEKGCLPAALYPHIRTYTGNSRLPHYPRYIYLLIEMNDQQAASAPSANVEDAGKGEADDDTNELFERDGYRGVTLLGIGGLRLGL